MEDLKRRAVRSGFARLCGQAINFALRIGSMVALARLLDPADFGLVAMVAVVTGIYGLFVTGGLSTATVQKAKITHEQISTLFWINLLIGMILTLLSVVIAPLLAAFYREPRLLWVTVAMGTGFLFNAAGVQHSALLERQLRYLALTVIDTVSQLVSIVVGIGMAIAGFGYWALVIASIVLPAISTGLKWVTTGWVPGMPCWDVGIRSMLRFGGTVTLNSVIAYISYNLEKVLLGRFWGPDALGIYGRAYQLINIPTENLNSAIGGIAFSALSRLQDDPIRLKTYFLKGYSLVVSLTIPISLFSALFADDIVLILLGPKWREAAIIFRLLTPTILIFGMINPFSWLLFAIGLQERSLAIALVIAPLVVAAYFIGLPYGPTGVAFAYSAAMTLWLVPHIVWCLCGTMISPRDLLLPLGRPFISGLVAAAFAVGVQFAFPQLESPFWRLAFGGAVMLGSYMGMLLFVMGQRMFYLELFKELRRTSKPNGTASRRADGGSGGEHVRYRSGYIPS